VSTNKETSNLKPRLAPLKSGLSIAAEIGILHFTYMARKTIQGSSRAFLFSLASCLFEIENQRKNTVVGANTNLTQLLEIK
jgi:hypothetical protein